MLVLIRQYKFLGYLIVSIMRFIYCFIKYLHHIFLKCFEIIESKNFRTEKIFFIKIS